MNDLKESARHILEQELGALLRQVEDWLEKPMIVLAFLWLALMIVEFIWDAPPAVGWFVTAIWVVFILEYPPALRPGSPEDSLHKGATGLPPSPFCCRPCASSGSRKVFACSGRHEPHGGFASFV